MYIGDQIREVGSAVNKVLPGGWSSDEDPIHMYYILFDKSQSNSHHIVIDSTPDGEMRLLFKEGKYTNQGGSIGRTIERYHPKTTIEAVSLITNFIVNGPDENYDPEAHFREERSHEWADSDPRQDRSLDW